MSSYTDNRHKYVVTNSKKLEAFLRDGKKINDLGMVVGQLTGKPKYPRGHVGRRSRDKSRAGKHDLGISPEEKSRRLQMQAAKRYLNSLPKEARKSEMKRLRAELKASHKTSRGLGRRKAGAVAVAKVAGVLASREQYHLRALRRGQVLITTSLDKMRNSLLKRGGSVAGALTAMGRGLKELIRASFRQTGHDDSGRLVRNIQYEIYSKGGKSQVLRLAKEERARIRASKKAKKGRR